MKLSIRKFLLINLLLAITATTSLSTLGNYYLDQQDIQNSLDNMLSQAALTVHTLIGEDIRQRDLKQIQEGLNQIPNQVASIAQYYDFADSARPYPVEYKFQIWDNRSEKLLLHSVNAPNLHLLGNPPGFSDRIIDGEPWRVFTLIDPEQHLTFVVAEHYDTRNWLAQRITEDDIYIMLITYPLSGILIWLIIGRGLRSIKRVANEVSQRAADRLDAVDVEAVPVEITPLIDELNKLFLRLKQAFEREQRFAADAAHELRTPLAALKTQAQVALKAIDPMERQAQLQNVTAGVDRCTHVIQQLLTLCRMSPETVTLEDPTEVDLAKITMDVIGQLAPTAIDKKIDIEYIAKEQNYLLIGNATGLHALVRNLVDNAIRYTPEEGQVKVLLNSTSDHIQLCVIDNGPGIPIELRSRVFERFFRIIGNTAQGSGLGLAIVQQIVKLHRGKINLGAPTEGTGLMIEVLFPRSKGFSYSTKVQ